MKNKSLLSLLLIVVVIFVAASCSKDGNSSSEASTDYSFKEEFDTVSKAVSKGWVIANNTKPIGTIGWIQGFFYFSMSHESPGKTGGQNYPFAGGISSSPSVSGTDFIMTTSECGSGIAGCSNWLISPEVVIKNGDQISFYTRTYKNPAVGADRLQLRINPSNSSSKVGVDSNSVGNFTTVLWDLNPGLLLEGVGSYPEAWTKYTVTVTGMPVAKKSRVAFRYYVPNGGPLGANGLGVGIDKFEFRSK